MQASSAGWIFTSRLRALLAFFAVTSMKPSTKSTCAQSSRFNSAVRRPANAPMARNAIHSSGTASGNADICAGVKMSTGAAISFSLIVPITGFSETWLTVFAYEKSAHNTMRKLLRADGVLPVSRIY